MSKYPPLTRKIDYGLYFCESDRYGSQTTEVSAWSNTTVHWCYRDHHSSEASANEWLKTLVKSCQKTYSAKRKLHLDLNLQATGPSATPLDATIRALAPFWPRVTTISIADEPPWNVPKTGAMAASVRRAVRGAGLSARQLGVVYSVAQVAKFPRILDSLDFAGVELYTATSAAHEDSARNVSELRAYTKKAFALVPRSKEIVAVLQTYSRNYDFNGIRDLPKGSAAYKHAVQNMIDILDPMYEALKDPRVRSALCFSWARASGSREYKRMSAQLAAIGKAACSGR